MSNHDWMLNAIATAMTQDRLDCLASDIKVDTEGGADYTLDADNLQALRAAWGARVKELRK